MIYGYARVSTPEQDMGLQIDALEKAGCARIFTDVAGGAKAERAGLAEALAYLQLQNDLSQHLLILKRTLNVRTYAGRRQTAPSL